MIHDPLTYAPVVDPWTLAAVVATVFGIVAFARSTIRNFRRRSS